jgi:putative transposase
MKTFKFRLYPNENQKILLDKHIGSSRFLYNFFLNYSKNCYENSKTSTTFYDWSKELTLLKKTEKYSWLNEINSQVLQASLKNLDKSFQRFYKNLSGYPKFKKKSTSKWSFSIPQNISLEYSETNDKFGYLKFFKFTKNPIKTRIHRILPIDYKIKTATIIKSRTNKYFVSLVIEYQPQGSLTFVEKNNPNIIDGVGIDVGIKDTLILSNGQKYTYPIKSKLFDKKIKKLNKQLAHKYKPGQQRSKNFEKTRIKLAKLYEKISNIKENWIHQMTSKIISENQGNYIFMEDLNVKGMLKNHKLAKAIQFQSWYKFKEVLKYKALWNDQKVVSIDRWIPSTKTCHKCGFKNDNITLDDRVWTCPKCGTEHDRDINAAINIKQFGIKQLATV